MSVGRLPEPTLQVYGVGPWPPNEVTTRAEKAPTLPDPRSHTPGLQRWLPVSIVSGCEAADAVAVDVKLRARSAPAITKPLSRLNIGTPVPYLVPPWGWPRWAGSVDTR